MDYNEKLAVYKTLLLKWQNAINLVSPSTLCDAENRHFKDSAQLEPYIPANTKTLVDIGSGAGFPAIVLSILRPDITIICIESDARKCEFLKTVSRETQTPVTIINDRIESAIGDLAPDLITARALADVQTLFDLTQPSKASYLLLKGKNAESELEAAQKQYDFDAIMYSSQTDSDAKILLITGVKPL